MIHNEEVVMNQSVDYAQLKPEGKSERTLVFPLSAPIAIGGKDVQVQISGTGPAMFFEISLRP